MAEQQQRVDRLKAELDELRSTKRRLSGNRTDSHLFQGSHIHTHSRWDNLHNECMSERHCCRHDAKLRPAFSTRHASVVRHVAAEETEAVHRTIPTTKAQVVEEQMALALRTQVRHAINALCCTTLYTSERPFRAHTSSRTRARAHVAEALTAACAGAG